MFAIISLIGAFLLIIMELLLLGLICSDAPPTILTLSNLFKDKVSFIGLPPLVSLIYKKFQNISFIMSQTECESVFSGINSRKGVFLKQCYKRNLAPHRLIQYALTSICFNLGYNKEINYLNK
jgi:hypothetical protein